MAYTKLNWLNRGETGAIPINKDNLNHMDNGIANNDGAIGNLANLNTSVKDNLVNAINSTIIESGTNNNGTYIKYADGTMICTKKVTGQANITSTWGNLYDTGDNPLDLGNWAIPFIDVPIVSISFYGANGQWVEGFQTSITKEKVGKITIASATSKTALISSSVSFQVWKKSLRYIFSVFRPLRVSIILKISALVFFIR